MNNPTKPAQPTGVSTETYHMFGRAIQVGFDESPGSQVLRQELSLYPRATPDVSPELLIRHAPVTVPSEGLRNPSVHYELENGFLARFKTADVQFFFEEDALRRIDFYEAGANGWLRRQARRALNEQFTTRDERLGMTFHELALLPAMYFCSDLALVHASAVEAPSGDVVLIGGTGGVGKTSLEIELCLHHGFRFVADDLSGLTEEGHVWPNLAYPKIYAYNLEDNAELAERVLGQRGMADRLHWTVHRQRGAARVRRRVAPDKLYGAYSTHGGPIGRYLLLVRETRRAVDVAELTPARAAAMSTAVMETEYQNFNSHLQWHAFNRHVWDRSPTLTVRDTLDRWHRVTESALQDAECLLVRIPTDIEHAAFKREVAALLT